MHSGANSKPYVLLNGHAPGSYRSHTANVFSTLLSHLLSAFAVYQLTI